MKSRFWWKKRYWRKCVFWWKCVFLVKICFLSKIVFFIIFFWGQNMLFDENAFWQKCVFWWKRVFLVKICFFSEIVFFDKLFWVKTCFLVKTFFSRKLFFCKFFLKTFIVQINAICPLIWMFVFLDCPNQRNMRRWFGFTSYWTVQINHIYLSNWTSIQINIK